MGTYSNPFFIIANSEEEAEKKVRSLLAQITASIPQKHILVRTDNSVTIVTGKST